MIVSYEIVAGTSWYPEDWILDYIHYSHRTATGVAAPVLLHTWIRNASTGVWRHLGSRDDS